MLAPRGGPTFDRCTTVMTPALRRPRGATPIGFSELDLRHYLNVLARRGYIIVLVVIVAVSVALAATLLRPARWRATATVQVEPGTAFVGGSVRADDLDYVDRLVNTYSRLVKSDRLLGPVSSQVGLHEHPEVSAEGVAGTNLMNIHATVDRRADAARTANAIAAALVSEVGAMADSDIRAADAAFDRTVAQAEDAIARGAVRLAALRAAPQGKAQGEEIARLHEQISGQRLDLQTLREDHAALQATRAAQGRSVKAFQAATPPTSPADRNVELAIALALAFGLVAGPGLAFAVENYSRRFRTEDEIEASVNAPILGAIPVLNGADDRGLYRSGSPAEEAFRRLRTTLLLQHLKSFALASAEPGEGKSTIVANLGRSLSESGRSVLLVDADLREPRLSGFFPSATAEPGLTLSDLVRRSRLPSENRYRETEIPNLALMPAGDGVDDPPTALEAPVLGRWFKAMKTRFDIVIVDVPALLAVPDALMLARYVDAVILVAGSDIDPAVLQRAERELERGGAKPLGVVVNAADDPGLYPYVEYPQSRTRSSGELRRTGAAEETTNGAFPADRTGGLASDRATPDS
jgi:capsular exopolysaccharide synthesis family protein